MKLKILKHCLIQLMVGRSKEALSDYPSRIETGLRIRSQIRLCNSLIRDRLDEAQVQFVQIINYLDITLIYLGIEGLYVTLDENYAITMV